ncbi:MAG: aspartate kinase [Bdellovibrionales bacterium]|nr:aspartate kinase [Bdellovibrionales bacterium]
MAVRVQKFGGAGLSTIEKVKQVALHLKALHDAGDSVIAVVSAMGSTTNDLIAKAYEISDHPDKRELDMLISTGERVSMSLLTMALKDLGCEALSLTGSQAGIMTDGEHSSATITQVKPIRVEAALSEGKIVVIAGFQGVNPDSKEITTLGRGGTDTTAVALAGHFKADRCEIIKEVDGICSADPRLVTSPKVFSEINYETMKSMCHWGTKALHLPCVQLAEKLGVAIWVGPLDENAGGTRVHQMASAVVAVNHLPSLFAVSWKSSLVDFSKWLNEKCEKQNWRAPIKVYQSSSDNNTTAIYQADEMQLKAIEQMIQEEQGGLDCQVEWRNQSALTLTGAEALDSFVVENSIMTFSSENSKTWIVSPEESAIAADSLHSAVTKP